MDKCKPPIEIDIRSLDRAVTEGWGQWGTSEAYFRYIVAQYIVAGAVEKIFIFGGPAATHQDQLYILTKELKRDGHHGDLKVLGGGGFWHDHSTREITPGEASDTFGAPPSWAEAVLLKHLRQVAIGYKIRL